MILGYQDWLKMLNHLCALHGLSVLISPKKKLSKIILIKEKTEGVTLLSTYGKTYLVYSNIINVNCWVLHSNGYYIVVLGMECQECWSRRRRHECCHNLNIQNNIFHMIKLNYCSNSAKQMLQNHQYAYLKCHHIEQWHLSTSGWHYIWVILRKCNTWYSFFKVYTWDIISHKKTTVWLPMLRNHTGSGL